MSDFDTPSELDTVQEINYKGRTILLGDKLCAACLIIHFGTEWKKIITGMGYAVASVGENQFRILSGETAYQTQKTSFG